MATVEFRLPSVFRPLAGGKSSLQMEAANVGEAIRSLATREPTLGRQMLRVDGTLRPSVGVFLNDTDIRSLDGEATALSDRDVIHLAPALAGGRGEPLPVALRSTVAEFPRPELLRFSRQILLPEVGLEGQRKLKAAKVLLVGAGGLGSPAALYLAAAGVGQLGVVEADRVDVSNLHRQVLYSTADVGQPKAERAAARLESLNPGTQVTVHPEMLRASNALSIVQEYDIVVDGSDNFPTRYLVNDACVLLGKPDVYGSVYRFEGQATVFDSRHGPCYRCLYPEPPPPGAVPTCAEGGVLGVLPGLIGLVQATETLKLVLGVGEPLVGRLLLFDALEMRFRELRVEKSDTCPVCGPRPTQTSLVDYEAFCGLPGGESPASPDVPSLSPEELRDRLEREPAPLLVDVRQPGEYAIVHLPGAVLIPRERLVERLSEITRAPEVVVYCKTGARSSWAVRLLTDLGVSRVRNLTGGIDAWTARVDPSLPRY